VVADSVVRDIVGFTNALREDGVRISPTQTATASAGLERVGIGRIDDVYWTLRQTLVSRRDDLVVFDAVFSRWFGQTAPMGELSLVSQPDASHAQSPGEGEAEPPTGTEPLQGWTPIEYLRTRDFAHATPEELRQIEALIAELRVQRPRRRSRRLRPARRGSVDLRRLVRRSLATGGEPVFRSFRRRIAVPRKVVFLCDVSGSMASYSRELLLFASALVRSGRGVEAFAFGTRLTRVTAQLTARDPRGALDAAAEAVPDWSGGTRIGSSLHRLNQEWGRRGVTRGAIVVIASDGWERDDVALVAREMARLERESYSVIWVNPLKGDPEYQPLAAGMRAALPHVDHFLAGNDLSSLESLADVLAGERPRGAG